MNNFSNNTAWTDLNDAEDQREYALIPPKTLAKVIMVIRPGGYDDLSQGWAGGYATRSEKTGAIYLNAKFTLLEGPFAKRVVFGLIGLSSPKGPEWSNIGRSFLRAILNSARGIHPADNSQEAQSARRIKGFVDLDSIEFVARIDVEKDQNGDDKNVIKAAIQPEHKDYAALMGNVPRGSSGGGSNGGSGGAAPLTVARAANSVPPVSTRPAWAS